MRFKHALVGLMSVTLLLATGCGGDEPLTPDPAITPSVALSPPAKLATLPTVVVSEAASKNRPEWQGSQDIAKYTHDILRFLRQAAIDTKLIPDNQIIVYSIYNGNLLSVDCFGPNGNRQIHPVMYCPSAARILVIPTLLKKQEWGNRPTGYLFYYFLDAIGDYVAQRKHTTNVALIACYKGFIARQAVLLDLKPEHFANTPDTLAVYFEDSGMSKAVQAGYNGSKCQK